jgi:hypothetical protein
MSCFRLGQVRIEDDVVVHPYAVKNITGDGRERLRLALMAVEQAKFSN